MFMIIHADVIFGESKTETDQIFHLSSLFSNKTTINFFPINVTGPLFLVVPARAVSGDDK